MENFSKVQVITISDITFLYCVKFKIVITCIIISMASVFPPPFPASKLSCDAPPPPPSCIWQSWSQAPAIPGWLAWLRGKLVASNIPDAGKAGHAASSVHGTASSPGCRAASLRHEIVRDRGPGRGRVRNVCIG